VEPWERGPGPDLSGSEVGLRFALLLVACAGIGFGVVILVFSAFFPLPFLFLRTPRNGVLTMGVGMAALVALGALQLRQRRRV
jgi:hypothetical protein